MTQMLDAKGLTPDEFAHRVFAAIDMGEYWIVPQPEMLDPLLQARNQIIANRADPIFAWAPQAQA